MDDRSPDATIYTTSTFAAPADAVSSAVSASQCSPSQRRRESVLHEAKKTEVKRVDIAREDRLFNRSRPAFDQITDSEFPVSNMPFHKDTLAVSETESPVAPLAPASPLASASVDGYAVASPRDTASREQEPWRERILLVEDEADIRNLLLHTLKSWGYAVQFAGTGQEALDLWRNSASNERAELILTDIQMPGLNGLELLRQVRADHPDMPVIVMTAFSSNQALTRALRLHANDFVAKPIEIPELQSALDRALRARRHREELDNERTRAARLQAVLETATAVNHEINNPLASISASAQLLRYHIDKQSLRAPSTQPGDQNIPGEEMDVAAVNRLLDVILEQCDRIADFNRKLSGVVNPVTRSSGGHKMLDVDGSR